MEVDQGIVLSRTKYGDSGLIVNVYTKSRGIQGLFATVSKSKASRSKSNLFQPLSPIQFTTNYKKTRGLPRIKTPEYSFGLSNIFFDPLKQTLAIFIAEVLDKCLTNQLSDNEMFNWLESLVLSLDKAENCTTFPHQFLLEFSSILGFGPDDTKESRFDLSEGCFVSAGESTKTSLSEEESSVFYSFITSPKKFNCSSLERAQLLNNLLRYYEFHVDNMRFLKSIEVIRAVYHT